MATVRGSNTFREVQTFNTNPVLRPMPIAELPVLADDGSIAAVSDDVNFPFYIKINGVWTPMPDGYLVEGLIDTESEHYTQHSDAIQAIISNLDGYDLLSASIISGAVGDGYVVFFTGDNKLAGDNDLYWNRETHQLVVNGTASIGPTIATSGLRLSVDGRVGGTLYSGSYIEFPSSGGSAGFANIAANNDVNISTALAPFALRINQNGRVGINTISPQAQLHVAGDGYFDGYLMPFTDNEWGLGTPDKRWRDLYLGPGSLHIISNSSENNSGITRDWSINSDGNGGLAIKSGDASKLTFVSATNTVNVIGNMSSRAASGASGSEQYGENSSATGTDSIAIGRNATAGANTAIGIGALNITDGSSAVSVGYNAGARAGSSVAIGNASVVVSGATNGIAVGNSANVQAAATGGSIAIGSAVSASASNTIAIGGNASAANGTTVGIGASSSGTSSTAVGQNATAGSSSGNVAVGQGSSAGGSLPTNGNSVAIGVSSSAVVASAVGTAGPVAIGHSASANQVDAVAVGRSASVSGTSGIAVGATASAGQTSIGIGNASIATGSSNVSVGSSATSGGGSQNVAIGSGAISNSGGNVVAIGASANGGALQTVAVGAGSVASFTDAVAVGYSADATNTDAVAVGASAQATALRAVAVGADAIAAATNNIAIGQGAAASSAGTNANCIAIGFGSIANGTNGATAVGSTSTASAAQSTALGKDAVANQTNATAVGYSADATGSDSTALGSQSTASAGSTTAFGSSATASGSSSTAIGATTNATNSSSVAIGASSRSDGSAAIAIGQNTQAQSGANNTVLVGQGAQTVNSLATAIGNGIGTNIGVAAVVIGYAASGNATSAVSIGQGAVASTASSTALGGSATASGTNGTTSLGRDSQATGADSTSVGRAAVAQASNTVVVTSGSQTISSTGTGSTIVGKATGSVTGTNVTGVGHNINIGVGVTGSTAIGNSAVASTASSTAVGQAASSAGSSSAAFGASSSAGNSSTTALGFSANASGGSSTAVGASAAASNTSTVAIGAGAVASGSASTAVGGSTATASGTNNTAIGNAATATQSSSTALGQGALAGTGTGSTGGTALGQGAQAGSGISKTDTVAVGRIAVANGNVSTAVGASSSAAGDASVAIGRASSASNTQDTAVGSSAVASGTTSVAVGFSADATAAQTVALGDNAQATAQSAIAIGSGANASSSNGAIAIGQGTISSGSGSFAMGIGSSATGANSIAIGRTSTASESDAISIGYNSSAVYSNSFSIGSGASASEANQGVFGYYTTPINLVNFGSLGLGTPSVAQNFKLEVAGDIGPNVDDGYSLGSLTFRWKDGYFGPGTLHFIQNANENDLGVNRDWNFGVNSSGDLTIRQDDMVYAKISHDRPITLGTQTTTSRGLTAGSVLVGGQLEIDGNLWVDSGSTFQGNANFNNDVVIGANLRLDVGAGRFYTSGATGEFSVSSGATTQRHLIFIDQANYTVDHGVSLAVNPTLKIFSNTSPLVDNTQWVSFEHNQDDGYIATGRGSIRLSPASNLVKVDGYILPTTDDAYGLGNEEYRWRDLYLGPGSIHIRANANQTETGVERDWAIGINSEGELSFKQGEDTKFRIKNTGELQLDSSILALAGSSTSPSYTFIGNSNSGMFSPGINTLGFTAGGVSWGTLTTSGGGAYSNIQVNTSTGLHVSNSLGTPWVRIESGRLLFFGTGGASRSIINAFSTDGSILLTDSAGTSFGNLSFGSTATALATSSVSLGLVLSSNARVQLTNTAGSFYWDTGTTHTTFGTSVAVRDSGITRQGPNTLRLSDGSTGYGNLTLGRIIFQDDIDLGQTLDGYVVSSAAVASIIPAVDNTIDLGSSTFAFKDGNFRGNLWSRNGTGTLFDWAAWNTNGSQAMALASDGGSVSLYPITSQLGVTGNISLPFTFKYLFSPTSSANATPDSGFARGDVNLIKVIDGNVGYGNLALSNLYFKGGSHIEADNESLYLAPVDGYVIPLVDDGYSLGSQTNRWKDIWLGPGTLHLVQNAIENDTGVERDWNLIVNSSGNLNVRQSESNLIEVFSDGYVNIHGSLAIDSQAYSVLSTTNIPTGTTQTIDWNNGNNQVIDLSSATGDVTLTLTNGNAGAHYTIKIIQHATTPRNIIWPGSVRWPGSVTPTISTGAGAIDLVTQFFDGTDYYSNIGQNY